MQEQIIVLDWEMDVTKETAVTGLLCIGKPISLTTTSYDGRGVGEVANTIKFGTFPLTLTLPEGRGDLSPVARSYKSRCLIAS